MTKRETTIPKAPFGRILLKAGAKRVSSDGIVEFAKIVENYADEIAKKANDIALHSGRKTIHEGDIQLALKTIN